MDIQVAMRFQMKFVISRIVAAVLFSALVFSVPLFAEVAARDDRVYIADFTSDLDGFFAGSNTRSANATVFNDGGKERTCLEVKSRYIPINSIRTVTKNVSETFNFLNYKKIAYEIYVPKYAKDNSAVYYTRFTARSTDGREWETLEIIEGGRWNRIVIDISNFSGRSEISSVEISFVVDTSLTDTVSDSFYIDDIYAFDSVDRQMTERFLFDTYEVSGGSASVSSDKSLITLYPDRTGAMSFSASLFTSDYMYDVNAIRLCMANYTDEETFTLYYSTVDERAISENKSILVPIEPNSEAKYYYIPIENAEQIKHFDLMLGGRGRVEISSLSICPVYIPEPYETCGAVFCSVSEDLSSVNFIGEVNREVALENQGKRIKIYKIDGELPTTEELSEMTPIVDGAMTTKFNLTWQIPSTGKLSMADKYIAVILPDEGDYILVAPPTYINNPNVFAKASCPFPTDRKGYYTDDLSLVLDSDAGITVLELDIATAVLGESDGVKYVYGGEAYYLNSKYFEILDRKIKALSNKDVDVLLRMTNRQDAAAFTEAEESANDYIGAVSSYAAEKWAEDGAVCGVILGYGENYIGEGQSLRDMIVDCTAAVKKVSASFRGKNDQARVYVSVTDLFSKEMITNTIEYPTDEYLKGILEEIKRCGEDAIGICVDSPHRFVKNEDETFISIRNKDLITALAAEYGVNCNLLFCEGIYPMDQRRLGSLLTDYVLGYYTAIFDSDIDGYIAVSTGKSTGLAEAVRLIDSRRFDEIAKNVLSELAVDSFSKLVNGFSESKLPKRNITSGQATVTLPEKIIGSIKLYEFQNATVVGEFDGSLYGDDIKLVEDGGVYALSVNLSGELYGSMTSSLPSWSGIEKYFEHTENLDFISLIGVRLKVESGIAGSPSENTTVKLVLMADGERFEVPAEVETGVWCDVYFSIEEFSGSSDVKLMQILVSDRSQRASRLLVKEITGYSKDYNDDSLESVLTEERLKKQSKGDTHKYDKYVWISGAVLVAVSTVIAVAVLSRKKHLEK